MKTKLYKIEIIIADTEEVPVEEIYQELRGLKDECLEILRLNVVKIGEYSHGHEGLAEREHLLEAHISRGEVSLAEANKEYDRALDQGRDFN